MEVPIKKYQRLYPGNEVRLKSTYIVKCTGCKKDENGNVTEVYATYDPATRGGNTPDGRKVRGTIHWVDVNNCADAEVRLYDNLFTVPDPDAGEGSFLDYINPKSLETRLLLCGQPRQPPGSSRVQQKRLAQGRL